MKKLLAMILAVAMVASFAACGSEPAPVETTAPAANNQTDAPAETDAPETKPAEGEIDPNAYINLALGANPSMLDPALTSDGQGGLLGFVMEPIMRVDRNYNLAPGVAESYEANDDATVFTYKIREGIKFTDGTPCDAEAIKWNFDRQVGDNATPDMPYAQTIFSKVESIEAPDATTLIINLKESDATLPIYLAMPNGCALVSPTAWKADPIAFQKHPVGCGAYKFVEWVEDEYVKLEANPDYFLGKVQNGGINFKIVKDNSVKTTEFLAGSVDYIDGINVNDIPTIEGNGFTVRNRPHPGYVMFSFVDFQDNEIFKDARLRQAVHHALDVDTLIEVLYNGRCEVAKSFLPANMLGGDEEYETFDYDPEKAKALMAEAGYPDGFSFTYALANTPEGAAAATAMQMQLEEVGIHMEIELLPKGEWLDLIFAEDPQYDTMSMNWGAAANDPSYMAALWLSANAGTGYNTSGYTNPEFDALIEQARTTGSVEKQRELYVEAAKMLNADCTTIFLQATPFIWAYNPNLVDPGEEIGYLSTNCWWTVGKLAK